VTLPDGLRWHRERQRLDWHSVGAAQNCSKVRNEFRAAAICAKLQA
jgi:hypothetical protein